MNRETLEYVAKNWPPSRAEFDALMAKVNDLEIKLSLAETRLAQATEACTMLTMENQRLRSAANGEG